MRRILPLASVTALALSMGVGTAAAAPTQARNYQEVELSCDGLGDITIAVVNRGHWGAAKTRIEGTPTTVIQAWAHETVSFEGTVVHTDTHAKGNDAIDDVCRFSWSETLTEEALPPGMPEGEYHFEVETGVKLRGR